MCGDATAAEEDLDRGGRDADVDLLTTELEAYAVVVPEDIDVIIDVHARLLPLCVLVADRGERAERRPVECLEEGASAPIQLLERPIVERVKQSADLLFSSSRLKKVCLRRRAMIQRSTSSTPASTFALSRGRLTRVGMTTVS